VQQGSFNYTKAAEESNGENVLVNWSNPKLAEVYLKDWKRHWEHSEAVTNRHILIPLCFCSLPTFS
jgi:hypothetical protein